MDFTGFIIHFLFSFGTFTSAAGLAVSPSEEIFVSDAGASRIVKFSSRQDSLLAIGGRGWDENGFDSPQGISANFLAGIFVADQNNHKIKQFQRDLSFVTELYTRNSTEENERFGFPSDVALQRNGDILVCDTENFRIVQFASNGQHRRTFGQFDAGMGRLKNPRRIALNSRDEIFVLDGEKKIVSFDPFGNFTSVLENFSSGPIRAISGSEEFFFVAEDSVLHVFHNREKISSVKIPAIIAQPWQDIALYKDRIFLLGKNTVFVCQIEFIRRSEE